LFLKGEEMSDQVEDLMGDADDEATASPMISDDTDAVDEIVEAEAIEPDADILPIEEAPVATDVAVDAPEDNEAETPEETEEEEATEEEPSDSEPEGESNDEDQETATTGTGEAEEAPKAPVMHHDVHAQATVLDKQHRVELPKNHVPTLGYQA
jgi:hypothetical protein